MLYEYAELRGTHKSLARYRYAGTPPPPMPFMEKYMDKIDDRYEGLDEADKKSVWYKPTEKAKEYRAYERDMRDKMYSKSPSGAGNTTGNRKTKIWNDKEV